MSLFCKRKAAKKIFNFSLTRCTQITQNKCIRFCLRLNKMHHISKEQKQPPTGVPRKRCSENMHQIYRKHACRSAISIKLHSNFIEIALRRGCSPVNLLRIFRTSFPKNSSGWLLLEEDFRLMNWLPTSKRVNQCMNTITFKFVNNTCPYYLKEIFEFTPHCRIDTRIKFAKLKIPFRMANMGQKIFVLKLFKFVFIRKIRLTSKFRTSQLG